VRLSHLYNRDIVRPVKKLLLILLMLILPVQYTWSAAAVYCQHEKNSPFHFGHHAHQHKVKSDEPSEHGKVKNADADCEYCHFFSHAFFIPFDAKPSIAPELKHFEHRSITYTSHIPRRPPRPNWLLVA
jgi:hypothetical protein